MTIGKCIIASSSIFLIIGLCTASLSLASNGSASVQSENKSIMLAEAGQHGQEKGHQQGNIHKEDQHGEGKQHRHGQDKKKEQSGGHDCGDHGGGGHGGHGKDGDDSDAKHDDKKSGGMKKEKHDYAHLIIKHANDLKLSDEQLGKITRVHLKHEKAHEEAKQKLKESMKAFKKESMNPAASDDQVRNTGKDLKNAFNQMVEFHIKERDAVHAILTDEQKNQLKTIKVGHNGHGGHDGDDHDDH